MGGRERDGKGTAVTDSHDVSSSLLASEIGTCVGWVVVDGRGGVGRGVCQAGQGRLCEAQGSGSGQGGDPTAKLEAAAVKR